MAKLLKVPQGFVHGPMLFYVILYIHKLFMEGVNNMHHQQIFKQYKLNLTADS